MLIISGRAVTTGFRKGELVTTGIYSVVRNPLYAAWILFIAPGILVFFKSWLMLLTPIVAYISFKAFIREEYQYLRNHFGQAYLEYEASVNELLPIPKFRRKK
jgi:protein-S-isoprenylcysteine O-methyltransferase Ste14